MTESSNNFAENNSGSVVKNFIDNYVRKTRTESVHNKSNISIYTHYVLKPLCRIGKCYVMSELGVYKNSEAGWFLKLYLADEHKAEIDDAYIYVINSDTQKKTWKEIYLDRNYNPKIDRFDLYNGKTLSYDEFKNYCFISDLEIWFDLRKLKLNRAKKVEENLGKQTYDRVATMLFWLCVDHIRPFSKAVLDEAFTEFKTEKAKGTNN